MAVEAARVCLPEDSANSTEVSMKITARAVVARVRNGAAPRPPKKLSPPPRADPSPPLPDCISTTPISVTQVSRWMIRSKVNTYGLRLIDYW